MEIETVNAIPKMTSNTTPSGVARASSIYSTNVDAWKAFDGISSTGYWDTQIDKFVSWISYEFPVEIIICSYKLFSGSATINTLPRNWTFEGSVDGIVWTVLDTQTNITNWTSNDVKFFEFKNLSPYKIYRLNITSNNGGKYSRLAELEMFELTYTNKILISLDDEIYSFKKGEYLKENSIPIMTSNTIPSGVVSASGEESFGKAFNAFNDTSASWAINSTQTGWLEYSFLSSKNIYKYSLTSTNASTTTGYTPPQKWDFEGWDGNKWIVLDTQTISSWIASERKEFTIQNPMKLVKYRINITSNYSGVGLGIRKVEMLEKTDSVLKTVSNTTEQSFTNHGMDKPLELDMATVFTQREIISEDGSSTIIQKEPFTLADEFEGKQVKILEYTDNPSQVESVVETETEPYSIYDEFGDTMEVLYYTDDPDKSKAELEITANYSPLDEIDEDFEVVTWTDTLEEATETLVPAITGDVVEGGSVYATEIDLTDVVKVT